MNRTTLTCFILLVGRVASGAPIDAEKFVDDASAFLNKEVAAHLAAVPTLDPPPPSVFGVPTDGPFTWGSFMRALAEADPLSKKTPEAARDLPRFLGRLGLIDARQGGKTFSQLGAAITLRQFGADLETNPVWMSLRPAERAEWRSLLDPARFYDRTTRQVINLPENYLGVAARIVALDHEMGIITDRAYVDDVLERAAGQFLEGALYADDDLPAGRYDRYSQEYARFVYEAAGIVGRADVQRAVAPALTAVMQTWWDLAAPDGYGYPWGRTIGAMSYMDTLDIIGFLAQHPEFRPAPLPDLASLYAASWSWLQKDYLPDRHLINMFGFGRGNYGYMTPERQWQQTTGYLAKAAGSLTLLRAALAAEKVTSFPAAPGLRQVARFEWFRKGDRPAGVWLVRQEGLRFALPITTGTQPGVSDYLPAPHGLPGFAAPVQQKVPALVPYLELADGRVIVAGDGADAIHPAADGRGFRAVWRRFAVVSSGPRRPADPRPTPGEPFVEPGFTTEVAWSLEGETLVRRETIRASRPVDLRRFAVTFPTSGSRVSTRMQDGQRVDRFESAEATLDVSVASTNLPLTQTFEATGNSELGKGTRGHIPLLMHMSALNVALTPGKPIEWTLRVRSVAQ